MSNVRPVKNRGVSPAWFVFVAGWVPPVASAHAGGLEFRAPLFAIAVGVLVAAALLVFQVRGSGRTIAALGVSVGFIVFGAAVFLASPLSAQSLVQALAVFVLLVVLPFLGALGAALLVISAGRRQVKNWQRLRELSRRSK